MPILHDVGREDMVRSQNTNAHIGQSELLVRNRHVEVKIAAIGNDDLIAEGWILRIATNTKGFWLESTRGGGTGQDHATTVVGGANHASNALEHVDARNALADDTGIAPALCHDVLPLNIKVAHMTKALRGFSYY